MKDDQMFRRYMAMLGEIHDKKITKVLTSAYWEVLKHHDDEDVEAAFKDAVATCTFFPKPAEILERIQKQEPEDAPLLAWARVMNALESVGPHMDPILDASTMNCVRAMGGWSYLCNLSYDELKWQEKRFVEYYETMTKSPLALTGGSKVRYLADKIKPI